MPSPAERPRAAVLAEEALTSAQRRAIAKLVAPALAFEAIPMTRSQRGVSKLGGTPDVDTSWPGWPTYFGWPMVFFGHLNFAEIRDPRAVAG